ncbi:MAG: hypothetical protein U0350_51460 [Caldilineaceae bacterium]
MKRLICRSAISRPRNRRIGTRIHPPALSPTWRGRGSSLPRWGGLGGDQAHRRHRSPVYRYLSHAQHFCDRFLVGYPVKGRWHRPGGEIVSLFVDQNQEMTRALTEREFGFAVYPTRLPRRCVVAATNWPWTLYCSWWSMATIPRMNWPILYPRYEFFKECVKVFEEDGRRAGLQRQTSFLQLCQGAGNGQ